MTAFVPVLNNDPLARSQNKILINIGFTLATAGSGQNVPTLIGADAPQYIVTPGGSTAPTQAVVDALLGTPNDLLVTTFYGATALVADNTYALVVATGGQIAELQDVRVFLNIGGTVSTSIGIGTTSAPANSAFTLTQAFLTPAGNLALRITATGVSLRTNAGSIIFYSTVKTK